MKIPGTFVIGCSLLAITAAAQDATNISDASITRYIQQRYERDPYLFSTELKVETAGGRVTVSGDVATAGEEFRALELAGATRGVRDVVDRINVIATNRSDSELRLAVRAAFGRDRAVEGREINVGVTNGIVDEAGARQAVDRLRIAP
jgi:osmotically-inducible protein OsmY